MLPTKKPPIKTDVDYDFWFDIYRHLIGIATAIGKRFLGINKGESK